MYYISYNLAKPKLYLEERKAPKTKSIAEVYTLLNKLSLYPEDVIYIYVKEGTKSFSIELINENTYLLTLLDSARHEREIGLQGVINVLDNFEGFLNNPTSYGFSEEHLY